MWSHFKITTFLFLYVAGRSKYKITFNDIRKVIPTLDNIDELKNKIEEVSNELINIEFEFLILDQSFLTHRIV